MPTVVEEIPESLQPEVDAALAWLNAERGAAFKVTGIVDPDVALAARDGEGALDLSLVLCEDDLCVRERVRVRRETRGLVCESAPDEADAGDVPAHLDPPAGARRGWLADRLRRHSFVVLVFYRGFW